MIQSLRLALHEDDKRKYWKRVIQCRLLLENRKKQLLKESFFFFHIPPKAANPSLNFKDSPSNKSLPIRLVSFVFLLVIS